MSRFFLELSYKGSNYHGWQLQNNAHTVQAELNNALALICREQVETTGCGRTDTGVHASQFFTHFDTSFPEVELLNSLPNLNAILPSDISIYAIYKVGDIAHARFDATLRSYAYYICRNKNSFLSDLEWHWSQQVDLELMNQASKVFMNYTDYGCFSKSGGQQFTNLCTISEAAWTENSERLKFTITANRFLRGMVRSIVGTMLNLGQHKINLKDFEAIIQSGDRKNAGQAVPAHGLFLEEIQYPYLSTKRRNIFDL